MIIKLEKPTSRKSLQKLGYYTCQINYAIIGLTPEDVVYSKNGCTLIGKIEDFDEQGLPVREWLDKATKRIWNDEQQKYYNSYIPYLDCKVCGKLMVIPKEEIYCDNCKEEGHRQDLEKMAEADRKPVEQLATAIILRACKDYYMRSRKDEVKRFMKSNYFSTLSFGLNGEYALHQLQNTDRTELSRTFNKRGTWE